MIKTLLLNAISTRQKNNWNIRIFFLCWYEMGKIGFKGFFIKIFGHLSNFKFSDWSYLGSPTWRRTISSPWKAFLQVTMIFRNNNFASSTSNISCWAENFNVKDIMKKVLFWSIWQIKLNKQGLALLKFSLRSYPGSPRWRRTLSVPWKAFLLVTMIFQNNIFTSSTSNISCWAENFNVKDVIKKSLFWSFWQFRLSKQITILIKF